MTAKHPNKLIEETSPYLLQHAYNPVQWYPWGTEALELAKKYDKPILVSIGYAACHWCHVMERESFENEETARFMNEHFINIKIDREERPDLDHIYMDAVQAMTGSGGWPLNVFLTPGALPFYGGTYFPPLKAYNRPSWKDVLTSIRDAWVKRREELEEQARKLLSHISSSGKIFSNPNVVVPATVDTGFTAEQADIMAVNILRSADTAHGGFGNAPKFPQTFTIQYLLAYAYFTGHEKALLQAVTSLDKMLQGGIYDHLAGGLARYSTDKTWLVPHFEKMLYDNALLVSVLADAYQLTQKKHYADAICKTLDFLVGEMKHPQGGFYAALDADSEGEEGKYYVWEKQEIDDLLGEEAELYCSWFNITDNGNWEGKNILHINQEPAAFAAANNMGMQELENFISRCNGKLLGVRNKRVRPLTDDKILLGWNALLVTAFCKAYAATGIEKYKDEAVELFDFINRAFAAGEENKFWHTYKNNTARYPAFLDDYAYLIQACLYLHEISSGLHYLEAARNFTQYVLDHFEDGETGFFYFTHIEQNDVITRKMDVHDGATPSGNSVMAGNLYYLSVIFEKREWFDRAQRTTLQLADTVMKYPTSFAVWASEILKQVMGINEIIVTGTDFESIYKEMLRLYLPNKVMQAQSSEIPGFPLLKGKDFSSGSCIYLCRDYTCKGPVYTVSELLTLLKKPAY